jgi:DNA transformation protein and related proteins
VFRDRAGRRSFLKVDELSQQSFAEAGSSPFIYIAKGRPMTTSFWRLPAIAHAETDELRRWASLGLEGARRAAAAKARKPAKARKT